MRCAILLVALTLGGCASLGEIARDIDDSAAEAVGTYSAPTLAGSPQPSGCTTSRCKKLDALEAKGYELARQKKITWVKFVDAFYQKRAELYPGSYDRNGVNELRAYQRVLAEQMDLGKLTESQWAYLIEKKNADIRARN